MKRYFAIFQPQKEGGYTVTFPDLPGCITEGDDYDDAVNNAAEALALYIEVTTEDGDILPKPSEPKGIATKTKRGELVVGIIALPAPGKPKAVNVSIGRNLLKSIDEYAAANDKTRSDILIEGVALLMKNRPIIHDKKR